MSRITNRSIGPFTQFLIAKASWILCILALSVLVFRLGDYYLNAGEEAYYAATAREMLDLGKVVTAQFNFAPIMSREILFYWAEMLSFRLFGLNEFAARIPSVLAALSLIALVYHILASQGSRSFTAWILITCPGFFLAARTASPSMLQCLSCSAIILFFYLACLSPQHKKYLYLSFLSFVLSVLVGAFFNAILSLLTIACFLLWQGNLWNFIREYKREILGSLLLLLVGFLPLIYKLGYFESFSVTTTQLGLSIAGFSVKTFTKLLVGYLPWIIFMPFIVWDIIRPIFHRQPIIIENPLIMLSVTWVAVYTLALLLIASITEHQSIELGIYIATSIITAIWLINQNSLKDFVPKIIALAYIVLFASIPVFIEHSANNAVASNTVLFAKTIPEHAELIAVAQVPNDLVFYAKRAKAINLVSAKVFYDRVTVNAPVYFIAKRNLFKDLTELNDCCEVFKADEQYIYGKNLAKTAS